MANLLIEFWSFMRIRKRFWMLPIVLLTTFFAVLMLYTNDSTVAPFVYALF